MAAPKSLATLMLGSAGEFNHSVWQAMPTLVGHDPLDQLITLHERSHFELNNVSSFGMLLTFLSELARRAGGEREHYNRLLNGLVQRSRAAHEVYATWYSVEQLSAAHSRHALLASLPPEYRAYHSVGDRIVGKIQSPFLRHQVFLTAVRSCFEAAPFADFDPAKVDQLQIGAVRARDYPDNRLRFLLEHPPEALLHDSATAFCRSCPDREAVRLIEGALAAGEDRVFFEKYSPEADQATLHFLRWLYSDLAKFLEDRQRPVGAFGSHLSLVHRLVTVMDGQCVVPSVSR